MDLQSFIAQINGFGEISHPEKIKVLGWYLHTHECKERFDAASIRRCYEILHFAPPNLGRDLDRLTSRRPKALIKDALGYRLEARVRATFDTQYGQSQTTISVTKLLADLPRQLPSIEDREFLAEAVACYRARAFRACVVMAWNLAFDHLARWILADAKRLATFNTSIAKRYPKKTLTVQIPDDFEDMKESEVIEVLNSSGLVAHGVIKILNKELARRNSAAHPSSIQITQHQAEDALSDLVLNVILKTS